MCQSDNGSIDDTSALRQWSINYIRALDATKDPRSALQLQSMFTAAGFVDVETRMIPLPLCGWSNSELPSAWYHQRDASASITPHLVSCSHLRIISHTYFRIDPREQRIGTANSATIQQALGSLSLFPFTRLLGMEIEEYDDLIRRARLEAQNPALKAYFPLYEISCG